MFTSNIEASQRACAVVDDKPGPSKLVPLDLEDVDHCSRIAPEIDEQARSMRDSFEANGPDEGNKRRPDFIPQR